MSLFHVIPSVAHVGTLDMSDRTPRESLEAMMLSVSLHPDEWRSIARCGGAAEWTLSAPGAEYLDAYALDDGERAKIVEWAVEKGYLQKNEIWRSWFFDGESDDWAFLRFDTEDKAWHEVDDDEEVCPHTKDGQLVDKVDGLVLTEAAMTALERWAEPLDGAAGALILYAREVILPTRPDMVGIWWPEIESPQDLWCPRGGIFPERLERMTVEPGWAPDDDEVSL